jgi:serine/threonine-protein kinase
MPEVGDILGDKYMLTREIGKGGMGVVFEAEHLELRKRVAIKFPHQELVEDALELERFKREPRVAAATGHPGIVDVYDIGVCEGGTPYVVMELLEGRSLGSLIDEEGRLETDLAVYITAQVLSALAAAHAKKIIHRDLKPDNVFLVETCQTLPSIKLLDFGSSKMIEGSMSADALTESGVIRGTPCYMAPEQISGDCQLDKRLDIYAAGVLLYEMLTGRRPFEADHVFAMVHRVLYADFPPPRELRADVPAELEAIVLRAMSRDREARFSTAEAMLQALLPFTDPVTRGRISFPDGLNPDACLESGSEDIATAATMREVPIPATLAARVSPPPAASPPPKRRRSGAIAFAAATVLALGIGGVWWFVGRAAGGEAATDAPATAGSGPAPVKVASEPAAPVVEPMTEEVPSGPDAGASPVEAAGGDVVTLTLTNVPADAEVYLGDARLDQETNRVSPSPEERLLEVRLPAGRIVREPITLDESTSIDVTALVATHSKRRTGDRDLPRKVRPPAGSSSTQPAVQGGEDPEDHDGKRRDDMPFENVYRP